MSRHCDLRLDARLVVRIILHAGRVLTVTVSPSASRAYVTGAAAIVALDARELEELRAALAAAADVLAEEPGDG